MWLFDFENWSCLISFGKLDKWKFGKNSASNGHLEEQLVEIEELHELDLILGPLLLLLPG